MGTEMRFCLSEILSRDMMYKSSDGYHYHLAGDLYNILLRNIKDEWWIWGVADGVEFEIDEKVGDIRVYFRDILIREYPYLKDYIKCFFEEDNVVLSGREKTSLKEITIHLLLQWEQK